MSFQLNIFTWFQKRELDHCPNHFISSKTPITEESLFWIQEKLVGRFSIFTMIVDDEGFYNNFPAFEDPKELILYELTWSN